MSLILALLLLRRCKPDEERVRWDAGMYVAFAALVALIALVLWAIDMVLGPAARWLF